MTRTHIALEVANLKASQRFYETLLGTAPLRVFSEYAQFLVDKPALNLALTETPEVAETGGHYGIEVPFPDCVADFLERCQQGGLRPVVEQETMCCHSRQEKFWVKDPDGRRWEVFYVTQRDLGAQPEPSGVQQCCRPEPQQASKP